MEISYTVTIAFDGDNVDTRAIRANLIEAIDRLIKEGELTPNNDEHALYQTFDISNATSLR
jgi:hypothetical protein